MAACHDHTEAEEEFPEYSSILYVPLSWAPDWYCGGVKPYEVDMWQMIVALNLIFPGPVMNYMGSDGLVHPIKLQTTALRFAIQGFTSKAACQAFTDYQSFPLVLTDANGNQSTQTATATFIKCEKQP